MPVDGSLRIKTKIDNSAIDKDIIKLEEKIKKIQLNSKKNSLEQRELENEINAYDQLCSKADEYRYKIKDLEEAKERMFKENPQFAVSVGTDEYENTRRQIEEYKQKYVQITGEIDRQFPKMDKIRLKLEELKGKQTENNNAIQIYNQKLEESRKKQFDLNYNTGSLSKELNKGITKILRYGAALFSIRSIYGLLSNVANSWLNGSSTAAKQLRTDIDYMKNAIGGALSPIIKYIVNLLYQALGLTGALIKVFTGIDIFAGSVADYMESTTSSASATNKELKKQLTSFDRINKLEENSTSGGSGGTGGSMLPSQNLSDVMNKYMNFAEKFKEKFEDIKDIINLIGAGILAWKLSDLFFSQLSGFEKLKKTIGLTIIIASIKPFFEGVSGIANGEVTKENLMDAIMGSLGFGVGTALLTGNIPLGLAVTIVSLGVTFAAWLWQREDGIIKEVANKYGYDYKEDYEGATFFKKLQIRFDIGIQMLDENIRKGREQIFKPIEDFLRQCLQQILLNVANYIEKIPIIGNGIATSIKQSLGESQEEITSSITTTTAKSIEDSTIPTKRKAMEFGKTYMTEVKNAIDSDMSSLQQTMENTNRQASENAKISVQKDGEEIGENYTNSNISAIIAGKVGLSEAISNLSSDASNSSSNSVRGDGQRIGNQNVEGIKQGIELQKSSLSSNTSRVIWEANNNVDTSSSQSVGSSIISGINQGINNNTWSLTNTIANVGVKMINNLKNVLGIHSPSKEMFNIAKFIPLGIAEGIDSTSNKAVDSMKNLVYDIQNVIDKNIDYSSVSSIPKIERGSITYIPGQNPTNELQKSIIKDDRNSLNKILSALKINKNENTSLKVILEIDGNEFIQKTIQLNNEYNLATNGGGL